MGNAQYNPTKAPLDVVRLFERDLPDLSYREIIGNGRFMKTVYMVHDHGPVVVKIFIKRDAGISLESHAVALQERKDRISIKKCPNAIPFVRFFETERGAYLIRQYFYTNLYDRISTRPFLATIEKKWIAFQLLHALQQIHDQSTCHGDIKTANVLVTTWLWVYISDFAQFKPTYIPEDNPTDFSFFFDTNSKRTCYLAPERFDNKLAQDKQLQVTPAMDIFSIGCVIAELFMEGQPIFDLSQLLSYRKSEFDPKPILSRIQDESIRDMVINMISLDPKLRKTARDYIYEGIGTCFPDHFTSIHEYLSGMMHISPDSRIQSIEKDQVDILNNLGYLSGPPDPKTFWFTNTARRNRKSAEDGQAIRKKSNATEVVRPQDDYVVTSIKSFLDVLESSPDQSGQAIPQGGAEKSSSTQQAPVNHAPIATIVNPLQNDGNVSDACIRIDEKISKKGQSIILFLNIVCCSIRNVRFPSSKRAALTIIWNFARYVEGEHLLQRLVPYVASMLLDPNSLVKAKAINILVDILAMVQSFPLSDANVFPEYIISSLSLVPIDADEIVRAAFAQNIARLAEVARNFLEIAQSIRKMATVASEKQAGSQVQESYDAALKNLKDIFRHIVIEEVLIDRSPIVRRAILEDITRLCIFFGRKRTDEYLLPSLITSLNERDWELRCAFFQNIVGLSTFVGRSSLESYILPCIIQALGDDEEFAVEKSLSCLASLSELGLFRTSTLVEILKKVVLLLVHPNLWIRHAAVGFVASVASKLPLIDIHAYLLPCIKPYLMHEISEVTELSLLNALKTPVSRTAFLNALNLSIENKTERPNKFQEPPEKQPDFVTITNAVETNIQERRLKNIYPMNIYNQQLTIHSDYMSEADEVALHSIQTYIESTSHAIRSINRQREQFSGSGVESELSQELNNFRMLSQHVKHHTHQIGTTVYESFSDNTSNKSGASSTRKSNAQTIGSSSSPLSPVLTPQSGHLSVTNKPSTESGFDQAFPVFNRPLRNFTSLNQEANQALQSKLAQTSLPPLPDMKPIRLAPSIPVGGTFNRSASWRPRGILVGHLVDHRGAINQIRVAEDNAFFATCSDDGKVKIWDCQRIDKNTTNRSVLTYESQGGRINSITICEGTHSIACASENGSVHVFRLDYATNDRAHRYTSTTTIREISPATSNYRHEGSIIAVEHFNEDPQSMLVFSTAKSNIHGWDLRTNSSSWVLKNGVPFGLPHKLLLDPQRKWLISATNRGYVTYWDLRFQIPLVTWKFPLGGIQEIAFYNQARDQPAVLISAGNGHRSDGIQMMTVWDVISMQCIQCFRMEKGKSIQPIPSLVAQKMTDNKPPLSEEFFRDPSMSEQYQPRQDSSNTQDGRIHAVAVSPDFSYFVSAGGDKKIRYWDINDISRSFIMSGLEPNYRTTYSTQQYDQMVIHMEQTSQLKAVNTNAYEMETRQQREVTGKAHTDSILDMKLVDCGQQMLISASRNGVIKIWK